MQAKVTRKSPFGLQFEGLEGWRNLSKFHKDVSLNGIEVGDTVEVEIVKDAFITSLHKVPGSEAATAPTSSAGGNAGPSNSTGRPTTSPRNDPQTRLEIARMNGNTAVYTSPVLAALLRDMDYSEAISLLDQLVERRVSYTLTGDRKILAPETSEENNG